ncbi:patatin-like phospholipase family protein [Niabella pedocola]|uniref:Patatin-like phospholipase family protein n=1 Tax=Niabella pedocola TaxID=1752077 RepID=A0ABS8PKJ5_9BACT|nr:patatin-like phospholipase family protein [Niabella pedocola]MCD2421614.1 patatin-like phospholipase family protein [Niabella pedocola]
MSLFSFRKKQKIIGLTLSGGGMRGVAHIGVLKALEEYGLKPGIISGSSAGAIIGAFYAAGFSPQQMQEIVIRTSFFSRSSFRLGTTGIFNTVFLQRLFKESFPDDNFNVLKTPLYVAATEITHGRTEYFSDGKLFQALLASASIPYIFPPIRIGSKVYMDGGILNNFPIEPIYNKCDVLIGSHVNSLMYDDMQKISARKVFDRVVHLAIGKSVYSKAHACDLFFDPPGMTQFSLFDKRGIPQMLDITYTNTVRVLEEKGYRRQMPNAKS